jgi:hypothetical protein
MLVKVKYLIFHMHEYGVSDWFLHYWHHLILLLLVRGRAPDTVLANSKAYGL